MRTSSILLPHTSAGISGYMSTTPTTHRSTPIEMLRVIAAFAIVWYHADIRYSSIAYFGLPTFIIITFFFVGQSSDRDIRLGATAKRILAPWAIWMTLLAAYNILRHKPALATGRTDLLSVLYGSYPHLWYLPFVFAAIIAVRLLLRVASMRLVAAACAAIAVTIFPTVPLWRPGTMADGAPIAQYAQALAAIPIGLVFAVAASNRLWLLAISLIAASALYAAALPFPGVGWPYVIAITVFSLAFIARNSFPYSATVQRMANMTFGIYLVHLPIMGVVKQLLHINGPLLVIVVFVASLAFVYGSQTVLGDRLTPR